MKAYVIVKQTNIDDFWSLEEVCLSEEICDKKILELNKENKAYMEQAHICDKCYDWSKDTIEFILKNECKIANVKTDRNGEYCESQHDYYSQPDNYYKVEVELNKEC